MLNGIVIMQTNLIKLVKTVNLKVSESADNLSSVSQVQLATSEELSSQAQEVTSGVEEMASAMDNVVRSIVLSEQIGKIKV